MLGAIHRAPLGPLSWYVLRSRKSGGFSFAAFIRRLRPGTRPSPKDGCGHIEVIDGRPSVGRP